MTVHEWVKQIDEASERLDRAIWEARVAVEEASARLKALEAASEGELILTQETIEHVN